MEPNYLDLATLTIATIGAITGIGALLWNYAEHRLNGARVTATIKAAMLHATGSSAITGDERAWHAEQPGFTMPAVTVIATNKGRMPATIEQVSIAAARMSLTPIDHIIGPNRPHRIEAGESATWHIELRSVAATVDSEVAVLGTKRKPVTAQLQLGDGTTVHSRNSLTIPRIG